MANVAREHLPMWQKQSSSSIKKVSLKFSKNSNERTCAGVSCLIEL